MTQDLTGPFKISVDPSANLIAFQITLGLPRSSRPFKTYADPSAHPIAFVSYHLDSHDAQVTLESLVIVHLITLDVCAMGHESMTRSYLYILIGNK